MNHAIKRYRGYDHTASAQHRQHSIPNSRINWNGLFAIQTYTNNCFSMFQVVLIRLKTLRLSKNSRCPYAQVNPCSILLKRLQAAPLVSGAQEIGKAIRRHGTSQETAIARLFWQVKGYKPVRWVDLNLVPTWRRKEKTRIHWPCVS